MDPLTTSPQHSLPVRQSDPVIPAGIGPAAPAADSRRLDPGVVAPLVRSANCTPTGQAAPPFKEHFMASLGTLPDEVLLEIITAMSEEAHRRANIGILPVPVDPAAATSAAAATAAASPMERITDDALLQVCTSLYLCTSPLPPLLVEGGGA